MTKLRPMVIALSVFAAGITNASGETVLSRTKTTGGTLQTAAFYDVDAGAGASIFQTTFADGTPGLYVSWGGPTGSAAGLAPLSAAAVQGARIAFNVDASSLLTVFYSSGSPGPCVGTFEAAAYDGLSYFYSTNTIGNRTTLYFQPFGAGGGIQYETKVAGHTTDSKAHFSGTCAGAVVAASSPYQSGYRASHTGNTSIVVTQFP